MVERCNHPALKKFTEEEIAKLKEEWFENKTWHDENAHTLDGELRVLSVRCLQIEEELLWPKNSILAAMDHEELDKQIELEWAKTLRCCGLSFKNYNEWALHIEIHRVDEKENKKQNFNYNDILIDHKIGHCYKCSVNGCGKKYTTKNGLAYHIRVGCEENRNNVRKYLCDEPGCEKKYKNANGLKYHREKNHKKSIT